jgi:hypothetical protein
LITRKKKTKELVKSCEKLKTFFNRDVRNLTISQASFNKKLVIAGVKLVDPGKNLRGGVSAFVMQSVAKFGHDLKRKI